MTKLSLLPEDPVRRHPDDPQYYEKCEAWQRERNELISTIDTESSDISHRELRSRIAELCSTLRFYEGNIPAPAELRFRRYAVDFTRESVGAYRP